MAARNEQRPKYDLYTCTIMRRPVGVILSCIVLGFAALMLLFSAAGSLVGFALIGHIAMPIQPGQPAPDPAMMSSIMHVTMIVSGLFYTALAVWAIITLVGLARMRSWARYSIMIIGGGLALVGLLGTLGMLAVGFIAKPAALPPGVDLTHVHAIMLIGALFWLAIAGVGVWWLVYFATRSTRDAFGLASNLLAASASPTLATPYASVPSPYSASSYQVASYIPASGPVEPSTPQQSAVPYAIPVASDAIPGCPLAITIIGWLLIVGALFCLPFSLLPFPLFMLGTVISGWAAHLTMLSFAVVCGLAGIGLLRLEKTAYFAALAFYAFGILNTSLLALPSVRDRMFAYDQDLMQKMSMGLPMPQIFDNHTMGLMMLPGIVLGIGLCAVAIVFLVRSRAAFDREHLPQAAA